MSVRLAVLCDFPEEEWPSMDLVAGMLLEALHRRAGAIAAERVQPAWRPRFSRLGARKWLVNADRLLNRLWDYPRALPRGAFDLFHVADHTYAHLVHSLPAERTGVFCHDLDAFRPALDRAGAHPPWARPLARHLLSGLRKASVVFFSTDAVGVELERLVPRDRLVHAPYGIAPEFVSQPATPEPSLAIATDAPFLLHVGSEIPRKRLDVLLDVFATAAAARPALRLVQVGGRFTDEQQRQIARLGVGARIVQLRGLERSVLASLYRRAAGVLLTSDAEGFGLPVVEALACGAPVIASDLPVTREVGGDAVVYCAPGDPQRWAPAVAALLDDPARAPDRARRLARARLYSWDRHAEIVAGAYRRLVERCAA